MILRMWQMVCFAIGVVFHAGTPHANLMLGLAMLDVGLARLWFGLPACWRKGVTWQFFCVAWLRVGLVSCL